MSKYERREMDEANLEEIYKAAVGEEDDVEFLKKKLAKAEEDIKSFQATIEEKDKALQELSRALKNVSFKKGNDPDNMNEDYDSKIAIPMLLSKLRQKQGSGWHFVENRMRYIS